MLINTQKCRFFYPEEQLVLSEYYDSYAEFSVLLNDTNYKSRLTQICEFDIARSFGHFGTIEYYQGSWDDSNKTSFRFENERVLYEDKNPEFVIEENNIDGEALNVYMLANGKQDF